MQEDKTLKKINEKKRERLERWALEQERHQHGHPRPKLEQVTKNAAHNAKQLRGYNWKVKDKKDGTVEIITYEQPQMVGYTRTYTPTRKGGRTMANEQNAKRARRNIHDIVNANWTKYSKFITLTYAEPQFDYDKLAHHFHIFRKRLRRKGIKFPYLWIVEHQKERGQKENNDGSLHIHLLAFTDAYIPYEIINDAWVHGFVKINANAKKATNPGAYVAKYIQKETMPPDKKAYRTSQDIKRPTTKVGLGTLRHAIRVADITNHTLESSFMYSIPTSENINKWKAGKQDPLEKAFATVRILKTDAARRKNK